MSVEGQSFPKSVQPGIPKLGPMPKGWKRYHIGDLFDVVPRPTKLLDDQEYDLVTVKRSRGGIERRSHLLGRQISVKSQFLVEEGDFLISKRQIVHGACAVVPAEFAGSIVSNEYSVLRPRPILSLNYLRYLVHSIYLQQTFFHSSVGVHVEKMIFRLEDWFKWPIQLPPVPKQDKLGSGLMHADAKITLLTDKKTALEDYKCGLMQRLFSRELRLTRDDGTAFPDWKERKLGQFATVFSGGTPVVGRETYYGGSIPFIKSAEIALNQTSEFLTESGLKNSSARMVKKADLLIALYGANAGEVAIAQIEGAINQAVLCVRSEFALKYVYHYLGWRKDALRARYLQGGQGNFSGAIVKAIKVPFPHPDEQRKIAAALSALDAKIDGLSQKIFEMEAFKKGLLQKLFV